jgi:hypothetical protein
MKKPAIAILVLFLGFYLMRDPVQAATVSKTAGTAAWSTVTNVFEAIIAFLNALVS